jgi:hypothetical protein
MDEQSKDQDGACCVPVQSAQQKNCPTCSAKGSHIDGATVKSMLSISLRQVREVPYRFCAMTNCNVVYFSEDGTQIFTMMQVREPVYQKEPENDNVLICYCFQHTRGEILQEFIQSGKTTIIDDINTGIQTGQCACDWRNPQGSCCLGNIHRLIKQLQSDDRFRDRLIESGEPGN